MLYENQQIGNFNYLLGYYLGQNNFHKPFSINTYQQTHGHDNTVGDMFGNLGGKYFILEFKRSEKEYFAELKKENRIKLLARLNAEDNLNILSKKGHFLCNNIEFQSSNIFSKQIEHIFIDYNFIPYYELIEKFAVRIFEPIVTGMKEFAMNLAFDEIQKGKTKIGLSYSELKDYLKVLKDCAGNEDYETTGTVACFNSGSGELVSIKFESLIELEKQLNLNFANFHELGNLLDRERPKPQLPPPSKSRGSGLSI